jgi:cytochrome c2
MATASRTVRAQRWALAVLLAVIASFASSGIPTYRAVTSTASVAASQTAHEATAPQRAPGPVLAPSVHRVLGPAETLQYSTAAVAAVPESLAWQQSRVAAVEPAKAAVQLPGTGVRAPPSR